MIGRINSALGKGTQLKAKEQISLGRTRQRVVSIQAGQVNKLSFKGIQAGLYSNPGEHGFSRHYGYHIITACGHHSLYHLITIVKYHILIPH